MPVLINGEQQVVPGLVWRGMITALDCEIPLSLVSWNTIPYAKLATRNATGIPKYNPPPVVPDGFEAYDACLMADASYAISRGTTPPSIIQSIRQGDRWELVESTDQVLLYRFAWTGPSTYCVAIRGTADANDGLTDSTIPYGNLHTTTRWRNNKTTIETWKSKYPGSNFYCTAHSLGGALADLAVEWKLVSFAYAFNPAVDPANYYSGLNTLRIYQRLDWMYDWFGQYCDNVFVYTSPNITFWDMAIGNVPVLRLPQQVHFHLLDQALKDFSMVLKPSGSGRKRKQKRGGAWFIRREPDGYTIYENNVRHSTHRTMAEAARIAKDLKNAQVEAASHAGTPVHQIRHGRPATPPRPGNREYAQALLPRLSSIVSGYSHGHLDLSPGKGEESPPFSPTAPSPFHSRPPSRGQGKRR